MGSQVPDELRKKARNKLNAFESIKSEIDGRFAEINRHMEAIKSTLAEYIYAGDDNNPSEIFIHSNAHYTDCLKFD